MLHRLLIFDRHYTCRLDRQSGGQPAESLPLLLGLTHSLRNTLRKMAPSSADSFSYRTNKYRLYYYESPTQWRFIMVVSGVGGGSGSWAGQTVTMETALKAFYSSIFVEWVVKNPLVEPLDGQVLGPGGFAIKMEEFFSLPMFTV